MKALELANQLENEIESHDGSSLTAMCQGIADDAAAELRRLAELNAELLGALEDAAEALSHIEEKMCMRVNPPTLENARKAIAKAKEQQ